MTTTRLATIAASASLGLLVLGGTALALGGDPAPTPTTSSPVAATSTSATSTPMTSVPETSDPAARPIPAPPNPDSSAPATAVGRDQAVRIALGHVGGGDVAGVEQEIEHGRPEWKVEIIRSGVEHDVRVDAGTGNVTRQDSDDRDSGGWDSDGWDSDDRDSDDRDSDDRDSDARHSDERGRGHDADDDHGGDRDGSDD
jgi:hypothetical protein